MLLRWNGVTAGNSSIGLMQRCSYHRLLAVEAGAGVRGVEETDSSHRHGVHKPPGGGERPKAMAARRHGRGKDATLGCAMNADLTGFVQLEVLLQHVKDESLKLTLPFGIGMHHAGLSSHERALVEEVELCRSTIIISRVLSFPLGVPESVNPCFQLYLEKKIQVMVATATLAWGINMPAHLVIVKGTEYYDGKTCKYVDYPVTGELVFLLA